METVKMGKRTVDINFEKVESLASVFEGGETVLYQGMCPLCDEHEITVTMDNVPQRPVSCPCGAQLAWDLEDSIDKDRTRKFTMVIWKTFVFPGKSQAYKMFEKRGK